MDCCFSFTKPTVRAIWILFHFLLFTANGVILWLSWNETCRVKMQRWLVIMTLMDMFSFYMQMRCSDIIFDLRPVAELNYEEYDTRRVTIKSISVIQTITYSWVLYGSLIVFSSPECGRSSPLLYYYIIGIFAYNYACIIGSAAFKTLVLGVGDNFPAGVEPQQNGNHNPETPAPAPSRAQQGPVGLTRLQLDMLPSLTYNENTQFQIQDQTCVVCLVEYEYNAHLIMLQCQHHFHKGCIEDWLIRNPTCPLCKRSPFYIPPTQVPGDAV